MKQGSKPSYETPDAGTLTTYGRFFWSVILPGGAQVNFNADSVSVESGALIAYRVKESERLAMLSFAAGHWTTFWAASMNDGRPVCVDKAWGWTP